jgi:hypothetical protein
LVQTIIQRVATDYVCRRTAGAGATGTGTAGTGTTTATTSTAAGGTGTGTGTAGSAAAATTTATRRRTVNIPSGPDAALGQINRYRIAFVHLGALERRFIPAYFQKIIESVGGRVLVSANPIGSTASGTPADFKGTLGPRHPFDKKQKAGANNQSDYQPLPPPTNSFYFLVTQFSYLFAYRKTRPPVYLKLLSDKLLSARFIFSFASDNRRRTDKDKHHEPTRRKI